MVLQTASCFAIVARFAQRLPVAFVPKQGLVSAMRNDVVHYGGRSEAAIALTFRAERMSSQELRARGLPTSVVPSRGCTAAHSISGEFGVLVTVHATSGAEVSTSRMPTWSVGLVRHSITSHKKEPAPIINASAPTLTLHRPIQSHDHGHCAVDLLG